MTLTQPLLGEHDALRALAARNNPTPSRAWLQALARTAPIAGNPDQTLPSVIEECASRLGDAPALLSDCESLTWQALAERSRQYTRWALAQGLGRGDAVCILMPNRPEYLAMWLGITRTGCVAALVNTHLTGRSLVHCVNIVAPKHIIVAAEFTERLSAAPGLTPISKIWVYGDGDVNRLDFDVSRYSTSLLTNNEYIPATIHDRALYLYTSGTTGLPKAANISHARLMQWSYWFGGMMNVGPEDRLYCCLPLYHSAGGVLATGAVLAAGGSVVIRDGFSASQFWSDVVRWECSLFQYIGELCRYLMYTAPDPVETAHRIRLCCGNGLRADIWESFKSRFQIPRILEFYASTEGNVSLFNAEGKPGAIGRIPSYLAHRFPATLVRFDIDREEPLRNEQGFCTRAGVNETGEAIGRISANSSNIGGRFEGYTGLGQGNQAVDDESAGSRKILRSVFEPGDAWFRTGDLMRRDADGYFYFVDRIGDTFRWKGENVSTLEVSAAICEFPTVRQADVYGVSIPKTDGRAGMALLVTLEGFDLTAFREHLIHRLPDYALPVFLRLRSELTITATFKYVKSSFAREGYDPAAIADAVYFNHREVGAFVRLDAELYDRIQTGAVRL
jgi:fatty-acyl-CoA synthase